MDNKINQNEDKHKYNISSTKQTDIIKINNINTESLDINKDTDKLKEIVKNVNYKLTDEYKDKFSNMPSNATTLSNINEQPSISKPNIYTHKFVARDDLLNLLLINQDLDVFKSGHFEGALHLGGILLTLFIIRTIIAKIINEGIKFEISKYYCLFDVFKFTLNFFGYTILFCYTFYVLQLLFALKTINNTTYIMGYTFLQSVLIAKSVQAIKTQTSNISPIILLDVIIFWFVLLFKMHSYFASNLILSQNLNTRDIVFSANSHDDIKAEKIIESNRVSSSSTPATYSIHTPSLSQISEFLSSHANNLKKQVGDRISFPEKLKYLRGRTFALLLSEFINTSGKNISFIKLQEFLAEAANNVQNINWTNPPNVVYPQNVNLADFTYFLLVAPTLVYEVHYPRTDKIRYDYILKEFFGFIVCLISTQIIASTLIIPRIAAGYSTYLQYLDMMASLVLPSIILWLLGFYSFFHCFLNAYAELAKFADRNFYGAWWNATSLDDFWRLWNAPMYEWFHRHVYAESKYYLGFQTQTAASLVFFVSAICHEIMFSLAFKATSFAFFIGMMLQLPMIKFSRKIKNKRVGNIILWLSILISQSLLEVIYFTKWTDNNDWAICKN